MIGNARYRHTRVLPNAAGDAQAVARALAGLGFEVGAPVLDADRAGLMRALVDFRDKADRAEIAIVFYAGHGLQMPKDNAAENYLVPVDARLADSRDAEIETVSLTEILRQMGGARNRIVVLDACRDNPLASSMRMAGGGVQRSVERGLARPGPVAQGTLIAFSTDAGATAADGDGPNSPFTTALLKHIGQRRDFGLIMRTVRADVAAATQNRQLPLVTDSLVGDIVLADR